MSNLTHNKKSAEYSGGFTFVETLVAISVLLLAVAGPLYLASQGLRAARIARDQIQANYIAQEAIEFIRYWRDGNALDGDDWMTGIDPSCFDGACTMDFYSGVTPFFACGKDTECPLQFEEDTGKYGYGSGIGQGLLSGWVETKFTRRITITPVVAGGEIEVAVTVSWQDGVLNRTYTLQENLLNWQ